MNKKKRRIYTKEFKEDSGDPGCTISVQVELNLHFAKGASALSEGLWQEVYA
jgi:hypothetical protein